MGDKESGWEKARRVWNQPWEDTWRSFIGVNKNGSGRLGVTKAVAVRYEGMELQAVEVTEEQVMPLYHDGFFKNGALIYRLPEKVTA